MSTRTYVAKTDLSAKKGFAVFLEGSDAKIGNTPVARIATANITAEGIIIDPPYAAEYGMTVCLPGSFCQAILGGTVTQGATLITDANGALVAGTTDKDHVVAIAREAGDAAEFIEVEIVKYDLAA